MSTRSRARAADPERPPSASTPASRVVSLSAELFSNVERIRAAQPELDDLRIRCLQAEDLTLDIDYFLGSCCPRNRRAIVILVRDGQRLAGAVLLHQVCFRGTATGLCRAGDSAGDGVLIAPESLRQEVLNIAILDLLTHHRDFHTLRLSVKTNPGEQFAGLELAGATVKFEQRTVAHSLPLAANYNDMLKTFGQNTRRNLKSKRGKLQASYRAEFLASLTPDDALEAMTYLRSHSLPVRYQWDLEAKAAFLRSRKEPFAMALRAGDGTWLSVLTGWRLGKTTYLDLQMNNTGFKRECLSAVMRSFAMENEIAAGQTLMYFVGGTSSLLERYCTPVQAVTELMITRPSIRGRCLEWAVGRFCDAGYRKWLYL